MKRIEVKDDPLVLHLPPAIDTNQVYYTYWDQDLKQWKVFELAAKSYDEWAPI